MLKDNICLFFACENRCRHSRKRASLCENWQTFTAQDLSNLLNNIWTIFAIIGSLTQNLGTVLNHPGPNGLFGTALPRSKRVAMYVVDGVVKIFRIAEKGPAGEEDPAGDDFPEVTDLYDVSIHHGERLRLKLAHAL